MHQETPFPVYTNRNEEHYRQFVAQAYKIWETTVVLLTIVIRRASWPVKFAESEWAKGDN